MLPALPVVGPAVILAVALVLVGGCGSGGGGSGGGSGAGAQTAGPIIVTSVTPEGGPQSGGTKITLTGSGFTGQISVGFPVGTADFASPPLATNVVVNAAGTEITCVTPAMSAPAVAHVLVRSSTTAAGGKPGGFRFVAGADIVSVKSIGPEGGTATVQGTGTNLDGVTLTVPPGAVTAPTIITMSKMSVPLAPEGMNFSFEPDGLTFATPATLTIPYQQLLAQNLVTDPEGLRAGTVSPRTGVLEQLIVQTTDPVAQTVSFGLPHFSSVAVYPCDLEPISLEQAYPKSPPYFNCGRSGNRRILILVHGVWSNGFALGAAPSWRRLESALRLRSRALRTHARYHAGLTYAVPREIRDLLIVEAESSSIAIQS